jgi:aldehyde:ferredoxin oxidoreductase
VPDMIDKYYELRGWVDGVPTEEKLRELGIAC